TTITLNLSSYHVIVIYPAIHSNTALAYKGIAPVKPEKSIKDIISQPITTWKNALTNDFERNLFAQYPELEKIKNKLYKAGALYVSMSGSGSAMYGIFEKDIDVNAFDF